MRSFLKPLLVTAWLGLAACSADSADSGPDSTEDGDPSDDGAGDDGATATRVDAGKSRSDAAVRDGGSKTSPPDGSRPRADAGEPADEADASQPSASADAGSGGAALGETGRLVGMTAAHNAVRAMVMTSPMLTDIVWDPEVAAYAQEWADSLASKQATCDKPMHRSGTDLQKVGYGENLALYGGQPTVHSTAKQAVSSWAGEVACWTYGTISYLPKYQGTEKCDVACYKNMSSDGCGHYTQIVWRKSTRLGCGVSTCKSSAGVMTDIWICNYDPAGNVATQTPY